jgi:hypothetical protein
MLHYLIHFFLIYFIIPDFLKFLKYYQNRYFLMIISNHLLLALANFFIISLYLVELLLLIIL